MAEAGDMFTRGGRAVHSGIAQQAALVSPRERQGVELIRGGPAAPELACRPVDYRSEWMPRFACAEVKVDGICGLLIDGRIVTLEGQPFDAALHCLPGLEELEKLLGLGPLFIHGEYAEEEGFDATVSAFRKGQGCGTLWVHDAVPIEEWRTDSAEEAYYPRKARLMRAIEDLDCPFVGGLASFRLGTPSEVFDKFGEIRRRGYEGLVIKNADAPYRRQRCRDWLRLKPVESIDLRLLDVAGNDRTGARSLILEDVAGPVTVTQGMNADQRLLIWRERHILTGTEIVKPIFVEVEHNGRTEQGKLRHPRYRRVRQDRAPLRQED